ncbi:GGDEF domain-containing protein [Thalassomonas haliotis]|uniref:diguanylate cyclase n=1 Tax=Thalassomonas haliotis TaxID=485448 RepID=A0ABY7VAI1_9GAMM|nr:GGDEF domain-containing protein [Thalassomonas haliotis]WDE10619.1 GGDEF domain-containing protein [Thalassomonas haliotis]
MPIKSIRNYLQILGTIGNVPENTEREKVGHGFLIYTGALMGLGGLLWGTLSFFSGLVWQSLIPYGYTLITIVNFSYLYYSKKFELVRIIQMAISVLLPFLFQISLGGFIPSGAVIIWSILSILVGFTFQNRITTLRWFIFYLALIVAGGVIDSNIFLAGSVDTYGLSILFFTLNLCVTSTIIFIMFFYFAANAENLKTQLETLAHTDPLTNISNRRHIFEIMESEFNRVKRNGGTFAVMMLDIDHFKKINDNFGHATGDQVIKSFSLCLTRNIRKIDSVGRYGGEEFIIFLPDSSLEQAHTSAQRINSHCRELQIATSDNACTFTVSIGISVFASRDNCIDEIIARADSALYQAKEHGRDQVRTSPAV